MNKNKKLVIPIESLKSTQKTLGDGLRAKQTAQPTKYIKKNCRFDYQPDLCKDFYETGYCGYGDNCKFIHDRSITKSSLTLDREWEEGRKRQATKSVEEIKKEEEEKQKKEEKEQKQQEMDKYCSECKKEYSSEKMKMVMKCGHFICSDCAIGCKKCGVCGSATKGVFKAVKKR